MCASVSTLLMKVGRLSTPRSNGRGGTRRRQRRPAVDVRDRRGLLAADVAVGRRDEPQGGPAGTGRAALVDGAQHRGPDPRVGALDVQHHLVGADGGGGDHRAVDHEVRRVG